MYELRDWLVENTKTEAWRDFLKDEKNKTYGIWWKGIMYRLLEYLERIKRENIAETISEKMLTIF